VCTYTHESELGMLGEEVINIFMAIYKAGAMIFENSRWSGIGSMTFASWRGESVTTRGKQISTKREQTNRRKRH
jgi:hypothetical protein